jgi:putative hemolysin
MNSSSLSQPVLETLQRVTLTRTWQRMYSSARSRTDVPFCDAVLEELLVSTQVSPRDLERIPKTGPVVVVANHPFGMLEGVLLGSLLPRVRPDVRFIASSLLAAIPEIRDITLFVDPYGGPDAVKRNLAAMKTALEWLKDGHMLVMFPAGEVATFDIKRGAIAEAAWNSGVARLLKRTSASVVPLYFKGGNSPLFHMAGLVHPRLRTLLMPHEFLNKQRQSFEIRIGNAIAPEKLKDFETPEQMTDYLRKRTLLLGNRTVEKSRPVRRKPVAGPLPEGCLAAELTALPADRRLLTTGDYEVWLASAHEMPNLLPELGRLREIAFRAAGEGTGEPLDIDEFDHRYQHMFLWHPATQQIAGAYRLGLTESILPQYSSRGLYTSTLFKYDPAFFRRLGPAVELGRSFVSIDHQKSYSALLSLWKGIGRFITRHPQCRYLFGPVSISNNYLPASRQLLVEFLTSHRRAHDLAHLVQPRKPFRASRGLGFDFAGLVSGDPEEVSAILADLEPDEKGVPVLLRQYLKLGGELLGFNLDRKFCNVVDGLILVDLLRTDTRTLERYLGKEEAARYRGLHSRNAAA